MRLASLLFLLVSAAIVALWAWMGAPVPLPTSAADREEGLYCVSYAPFRGSQTPFDVTTKISAEQVEEDLRRIRKISKCVRTYATDFGSQHVPGIARRLDMKVLMGIWIGDDVLRNRVQVETALSLANRFPDVIRAIIVGNEVLLRRDQPASVLAGFIKEVKSRTSIPVTYADVWEFWLKNPEIAPLVDFITIHTLPYWEDIPMSAKDAAAHIDATRKGVTEAFPGKEILIGEVGWPSAGRMRESALPSLSNQARVLTEVTRLARANNYHFNWIEVIDQPWKRRSEGTVGGYWGLFENNVENPKFIPGDPVSDHPYWKQQAALGVGLAAALMGLAMSLATRRRDALAMRTWLLIGVVVLTAGALIGLVVEKLILETLNPLDWVFGIARVAVVVAACFAGVAGLVMGTAFPVLARIAGRASQGTSIVTRAFDLLFGAVCFFTLQAALALIFDPRYRDFPAATLTMGIVPFLMLGILTREGAAPRGEQALAGSVVLGALWVIGVEGIHNWQALWFAATLGGVALLLGGKGTNRHREQQ